MNRQGVMLSADLLFISRVSETARQLGLPMDVARTQEELLEQCNAYPAATPDPPEAEEGTPQKTLGLVLLDLAHPSFAAGVGKCIQLLKRAQGVPIIAIGTHAEHTVREEAQGAGCQEVLVRAQFVQVLPDLLAKYLT